MVEKKELKKCELFQKNISGKPQKGRKKELD